MKCIAALLNLAVLLVTLFFTYFVPLGITTFFCATISLVRTSKEQKKILIALVKYYDKLTNLVIIGEPEVDWRGVLDYKAKKGSEVAKIMSAIIDYVLAADSYCEKFHTTKYWAPPKWNLPFK